MVSIKFTDNSPQFIAAMKDARSRGLEICGEKAESYAKALCPVDTGNLRNSITHFQQGEDEYVATNVHYAPYVELGTRRMKTPRPYLKPAAEDHAAEYKAVLENELRNG